MGMHRTNRRSIGRATLSLCSILFLGGVSLSAESRFSISPYVDYGYSDNIFWDRSRVGDLILSPGLGLDIGTNSWKLFLNADGQVYRDNDYLNSILVSGGASFFKVFSPRTSLFVSPEFSLTRYGDSVSFLDTAVPGIAIGVKHALSERIFSRVGLGFRYSNYLNEDSYDRFRLATFLELSTFFPTQTTLRFTLGMNYLLFPHIDAASARATGFPPPLGAGYDAPPDHRPSHSSSPISPSNSESIVDLALLQPHVIVRLAQGLGFKTGIVAEIMYRKNRDPLQGIQALAASEWTLEQTDEDFFWQGTRFSAGIKTESLLGLEIAVDLAFFKKEYPGIEALDLDGIPIQPLSYRSDSLAQANAHIAKKLGTFSLYVNAGYRQNKSNDLYFQYDLYTIAGGVEFSI